MQGGGDRDLRELVIDLQHQVADLARAVRELQLGSAGDRWDFVDNTSVSSVPPLPVRSQPSAEPPTTPPRFTSPGGYNFESTRSSPKTPSSVYNTLASEIPPCPEFCLRLATSLRGSVEVRPGGKGQSPTTVCGNPTGKQRLRGVASPWF